MTDLRGAISGGAAGWCFHNGSANSPRKPEFKPRRCFDLREQPLFEQWDDEEKLALEGIKSIFASDTPHCP